MNDNNTLTGVLLQLVNNASSLYFVYDADESRFIYLNAAFEVCWQLTKEKVYENAAVILDTIHPEDQNYLVKAYNLLLLHGRIRNVEFRRQQQEAVQYIKLDAQVIKQGDHTYFAGTAEDFTAAKEYMDKVNKFTEKKNSILEILSHDLATPLGNIQMCATLLKEETENYNNAELQQLLDTIYRNSQSSVMLIRDFVKQEFLESSEVVLKKTRVDLVEKINNIIEQFKGSAPLIRKRFEMTANTPQVYVQIDELKFMQVLQNLISNAIKFTHDNGLIKIEIKETGDKVLLTICDDGIGIPAHLQSNLFDKYSAAGRAGLKGEPSVGLGMSIIKKIVDWHNGRIWFKSEENKGTTFYIEIAREL